MTLRAVNYYAEGRAFEWCMGIAMMAAAIECIIWPQVVEGGGLLTAYVSPSALIATLLVLGWSRCAGLMLNGQTMFRSKLGPYARAICGVLSAIIWAQFVVSLIEQWVDRGYPSPGLPFWFMFTIGEIYTAYTTLKNRNKHGRGIC